MDIEKFKESLSRRSKEDLLKILKNTRNSKRTGASEYEDAVLASLDSMYPGWGAPKKPKQSGRSYNRAIFRGEELEFETAKDGYIWLVEKFIHEIPEVFSSIDNKTARVAVGHGRNYFARSPEKLFKNSPHLAESQSNFHRLKNGWLLNLNLANAKKFDVLTRLSWAAKMYFGEDWDWVVLGATDMLNEMQKKQVYTQEVWKSFEKELDELSNQGSG